MCPHVHLRCRWRARPARACLRVAAGVVFSAWTASARLPIHVRGEPHISGSSRRIGRDQLEINGNLLDELGKPIAQARIEAKLQDDAQGQRLLPCRGSENQATGANHAALETDVSGAYCVRVVGPQGEQSRLDLELTPSRDFGTAGLALPLDDTKLVPTVDWTLPPTVVVGTSLPPASFVVRPPEAGQPALSFAFQLAVRTATGLGGHREVQLDRGELSLGQVHPVSLDFRPRLAPGPVEVVIRSAGTAMIAGFTSERTLHLAYAVRLVVDTSGVLATPGRDLSLPVQLNSAAPAIPAGSLEVSATGLSPRTYPITSNSPRLGMLIPADFSGKSLDLQLRYRPSSPDWIAPSCPALVRIPVGTTRDWRSWMGLALALALTAWLLRSLGVKSVSAAAKSLSEPPRGQAMIRLAEPLTDAQGWSGVVVDAHDDEPIAAAMIRLERRDFAGSRLLAELSTSVKGHFELPCPSDSTSLESLRLIVTAPNHATLEVVAPTLGRLEVRMLSRRRALLKLLLDWARQRHGLWAAGREPTPAGVARAAAELGLPEVTDWAGRVEGAAFGPHPPTEDTLRQLSTPGSDRTFESKNLRG